MAYYRATVVRENATEIDLIGFCGIHADTFDAAVDELNRQLTMNPQRRSMYYDMWVEAGRPVICASDIGTKPHRLIFADRR